MENNEEAMCKVLFIRLVVLREYVWEKFFFTYSICLI